jgi:hypothetical protein
VSSFSDDTLISKINDIIILGGIKWKIKGILLII